MKQNDSNGNLASFTVLYINIAWMSNTQFLFWNVVELITECHNIMVYCSKFYNMVFFTLSTQIAWTKFTIVLCVLWTLRTLTSFICCACCFHDVEGLGLKIKTCLAKIRCFWIRSSTFFQNCFIILYFLWPVI